jgi:hypothetical protein
MGSRLSCMSDHQNGVEERLLRGPRAHSVAWMLSEDYLQGVVTCHCVEGADCRLQCPEGCESWNITDHEHPLVDSGMCLVATWINETDVAECHTGRHAPVDGFIEHEFDGDGFTWSYVDDDQHSTSITEPKENPSD